MSVLRNPPHVVEVQLMELSRDGRGAGRDKPVGERIPVACDVQSVREWSTEEEKNIGGLQMLTLSRIFARHWPGDERSLIYHDGDEYETVGNPQHFKSGRRTTHWVITIRRRGKEK